MSNNQIKKKNLLIICRGAGDLATGIIHRLHRAGHRVIALETDYPAAIRRQVSFCEAVYDGSATVEGLTARLLPALNDAETISGINDTPQAHIASQKWKSSAIENAGSVRCEAGCSSGSGDVLPGAAAQRLEEARTKRGRRCLKDERRKGDELCAFKLSEEIRTAAGHRETLRKKE